MKKATEPVTITLVALAEIADMRNVSWNNDWLQAVVKVWRLKPGEGVLYINKKHDRMRAVVALDTPVLMMFPVDKQRQNAVFAATVAALTGGKATKVRPLVKHALVSGNLPEHSNSAGGARIKVAA